MNTQHIINKCIRDKNNRVVIWQLPNIPIIGWFVCAIAARLFHAKHIHMGFADLSTAFLFVWAYLEIAQGASYFRRLLGFVVAVAIVVYYF
ncbi:MAG: hypothetical protein ACQR33_01175 [Candidatus Saccharibacteria bacterium]